MFGIVSPALADDEDAELDIGSSITTEFRCELGNKVTIYQNVDDNKNLALRWRKQLYRLKSTSTTTGAYRFENSKSGLVWIVIPTKAILLDSRKGQQLANECKSVNQ